MGESTVKSFASYHPFVLFVYYLVVVSLTVFLLHPAILTFSLLGAIVFFAFLSPMKSILNDIGFYVFVFLLIAMTNPIFVHKGETILFFMNDNPVTLEAIIYGIAIAAMLVAVIFWSKAYSELMTSDKFLYLFGKAIPKLSLVISMALRFIPELKARVKKVNQSQKTLGLYTSDSITDRVFSSFRTFNSVLTWSFEHAIHQADAMKARGYGLKGRTNFFLFKWQRRDMLMLSIIFILVLAVLWLIFQGVFAFNYYPVLDTIDFSQKHSIRFVFIFILMILPALIELKENLLWNYLKSKI